MHMSGGDKLEVGKGLNLMSGNGTPLQNLYGIGIGASVHTFNPKIGGEKLLQGRADAFNLYCKKIPEMLIERLLGMGGSAY